MDKAYKYIIENIKSGNIDKQTAVDLLALLKKEGIKTTGDIAIIGMAVNFPMADDVNEFWGNLKNGRDCISDFPEHRKEDIDRYLYYANSDAEDIKYYKGAYIKEIDKFDYKFFKMTPKQASLMDPNQRLILETMWHAVEDSGYGGDKLTGSRTGVYVGYEQSAEPFGRMVYELEPESLQISLTGNLQCIIPSRISYLLDLKGPSILIDTACSSALVAIHTACQGILFGDCETAIVGGVKLNIVPVDEETRKIGIESSDYITKAFDESSDGTGMGEGVAAVLLKPLGKALKDRDNIYAVIKSSAINQDGTSVGITAPNSSAQADVIARAWETGNIDPETISYIEAHGTGTKIGDPIEVEGIKKAFKRFTDKKQFCAIGTVKTNMGHLFEGSGMASLVKVVMSLKNGQIPPTLHFNRSNKKINFEDSPVYVNDRLTGWDTGDMPKRAGISAFGFSGTNCHIIVEEAPKQDKIGQVKEEHPFILTISAKNEAVLKELVMRYSKLNIQECNVQDICFTSNTGRGHYNCRLAVVVKSKDEVDKKLKRIMENGLNSLKDSGIFYGEHKPAFENKGAGETGAVTEDEKRNLSIAAGQKLSEYLESERKNEGLLWEICELYIRGAEIVWEEFYNGETPGRVSLPLYPFERERCWPEFPISDRLLAKNKLYYGISWKEAEIDDHAQNALDKTVLIFKDKGNIAKEIAEKLKGEGIKVLEAEFGNEYKKVDDSSYVINNSEQDFARLLGEVDWSENNQILHLSSVMDRDDISEISELEDSIKVNILSLYYLTRTIIASGINKSFELILVTDYASEVTGNEKRIKPQNSPIFGLGKVIGVEYHQQIKCRGIDIDSGTSSENIITEMKLDNFKLQVAYRDNKRYIEEFTGIEIEKSKETNVELKSDGVYIITGGTGGIGLETARMLASRNNVKLALIGRSRIPERDEWNTILEAAEDKRLCNRIHAIKEIEAMGAEVVCYSAVVSDMDDMKNVIDELRQKYGRINGVIHGAGIAGDYIIIKKDEPGFINVLTPKIQGTWILDKLTEKDNLDFFVMYSSVASIFSAPGQGDYAAANAYMDSYAAYRSRQGKKTLAIDWVAWKETGMAVDKGANVDTAFKAIETSKALNAFEKVLNRDVSRTLIGEMNLKSEVVYILEEYPIKISDEIMELIKNYREQKGSNKKNKTEKIIGSVTLTGKENQEDYTDTEKMVAQVWGETFGYNEIDINTNFYELGGDSLLAMKMLNQIGKITGIKINISEVMEYLTVADLSRYLDEKYLKVNTVKEKEDGYPLINQAEEREYYSLSSAQKRLYLLNQLRESGTGYNLTDVYMAEGNLDLEKMEKVLNDLIKRHEILRTIFELENGEPVQKVIGSVDFKIEFRQLDYEPGNIQNTEEILKSTVKEFVQPYDLRKAPLIRVAVIKLSEDKFIIIFDRHHIVSDAVSRSLFMKEFTALYAGEELPQLRLQYKDYAVWQNDLNEKGALKKQEDYWLKVFAGRLPELSLPTDFERPEVQSFEGDVVSISTDSQLTRKLKDRAVNMGVTLYAVLLSAYNVLLARYSGQEDIIVGSPMAGRVHPDLENVMGMFVNTVAIRSFPAANKTFREYLNELRQKSFEALENQNYQFDDLVDKLKITGKLNRNPLFDVMFILQNVREPKVSIDNLQFTKCEFKDTAAIFDLTLEAYESSDTIVLNLQYCTKLFKQETAERMLEDYIKILNGFVRNEDVKIGDIELSAAFDKRTGVIEESIDFSF